MAITEERLKEARQRITLALDVPDLEQAHDLVIRLKDKVDKFKVGLELLTRYGIMAVQMVKNAGGQVMYDGKFHDIPATMAGATKAVAKLGVSTFTVHASAGVEALRAVAENQDYAMALAVTVLTSLDQDDCQHIYRDCTEHKVLQFAQDALDAGINGLVCSPKELSALNVERHFRKLYKVIPGTRSADAATHDQKRVMTPGEAIRLGANELVIGRQITQAPSPEYAADELAHEIAEALTAMSLA